MRWAQGCPEPSTLICCLSVLPFQEPGDRRVSSFPVPAFRAPPQVPVSSLLWESSEILSPEPQEEEEGQEVKPREPGHLPGRKGAPQGSRLWGPQPLALVWLWCPATVGSTPEGPLTVGTGRARLTWGPQAGGPPKDGGSPREDCAAGPDLLATRPPRRPGPPP